jgi:drug/metabolite transporter (DMT)-like permease
MYLHESALATSILLTPFSQLALRVGARDSTSAIGAILNYRTLLGYFSFTVVVVLAIYALQTIPLRTVTAWDSLTYVLTPVTARLFLKDPLTPATLAGAATIVLGILVFSW